MPRIAHEQKQFYKSKIRSLISIDHGISRREIQERLDAQQLHLDRDYIGSSLARSGVAEVCEEMRTACVKVSPLIRVRAVEVLQAPSCPAYFLFFFQTLPNFNR
jgi:hypothetical protein